MDLDCKNKFGAVVIYVKTIAIPKNKKHLKNKSAKLKRKKKKKKRQLS